jgi:drug/metabolite transporter (DMT)-like permease
MIILVEATALYYVKEYSISDNSFSIIISIVAYSIIPLMLYKILKLGEGIAMTNIIWNIASTLYGLLIGVTLFSEHISFQQKIGAILGTVGTMVILLHTDN